MTGKAHKASGLNTLFRFSSASLFLSLALLSLTAPIAAADDQDRAKALLIKISEAGRIEEVRSLVYPSLDTLPPGAAKASVMAQLASLEFLAGNRFQAAELWLNAHSFTADDAMLLDAVRALLLCGEKDAALAHLDRIIYRGRDPHSMREAGFLKDMVHSLAGEKEGNPQGISAESLPHRRTQALFIGIHSQGEGRESLNSRYSESPESRILDGDQRVRLMPEPLWLLGLDF